MHIGIITFHASFNYGSMLQAYALQTYLSKLGHNVEIVNFRTKHQKDGYPKPISFQSKHTIKQSVKRLILNPSSISPLNRKWQLFDEFLNQKLNITREYNSIKKLKDVEFHYDVLITGSDQIWNTRAFDFSEAYFGTFVGNDTRKIAYAPSMGPDPESMDVVYLKKLLKDFKAVSVREVRSKDFLEKNDIYHPVDLVVDPTMLIDKKDYEEMIAKKPIIDGKYIFYYTPGGIRHEFLFDASKIGHEMKLPVVCENCYYPIDIKQYDNVKQYGAVGPLEFLNLIYNAEFVCGASFHLMVFSLIFGKKFCCMNGDVDSRMNNLMRIADGEDHIWSVVNKSRNKILDSIVDYRLRFGEIQEKSKLFLQNNL